MNDKKVKQAQQLILKLTDKDKVKLLKQALRDETFSKQKVIQNLTKTQTTIIKLEEELSESKQKYTTMYNENMLLHEQVVELS